MSGTSLDGLDIADCTFTLNEGKWAYKINHAQTFKYPTEVKNALISCRNFNSLDFLSFHNSYGCYIGKKINAFAKSNKSEFNLIASHGHTVFHMPERRLTYQIGNGAYIASETGITTISDFRTFDVALGGQGAPLVPIGDELLFHNYQYCLNLGGFSNVSYREKNIRKAFDICPVNIVINHYTQMLGKEFDKNGNIAKKGKINEVLLSELNQLEFYRKKNPKSLGKEWLDEIFIPLINQYEISIADKMRTIYEHISIQIANVLKGGNTLVTGGGAYNSFLIKLIQEKATSEIIIPDKKTIEFKEALIFAFLGVLRYRNEINCLSSVTGAKRNNIGGVIHLLPHMLTEFRKLSNLL